MFGIAAVVAFALALFFELADVGKGHLNYITFMLIGLLCFAVHAVVGHGVMGRRGPG